MIKMAFYWERICEYELKTTPFSLELFPFVKQSARLIEEHLYLGPQQVLKSSYLHKSLPKIPTFVGSKRQFKKFVLRRSNCIETFMCRCSLDIVLMMILFNDVTVK